MPGVLEGEHLVGEERSPVDVEEGGRRLIRVTDNGEGMSPEDALACFGRHATSKLYQPDDLFSIKTLGFRGEALPSIASVSRLTLETQADGAPGTEADRCWPTVLVEPPKRASSAVNPSAIPTGLLACPHLLRISFFLRPLSEQ